MVNRYCPSVILKSARKCQHFAKEWISKSEAKKKKIPDLFLQNSVIIQICFSWSHQCEAGLHKKHLSSTFHMPPKTAGHLAYIHFLPIQSSIISLRTYSLPLQKLHTQFKRKGLKEMEIRRCRSWKDSGN